MPTIIWEKAQKRTFCPAFGCHSTQKLVEIYISLNHQGNLKTMLCAKKVSKISSKKPVHFNSNYNKWVNQLSTKQSSKNQCVDDFSSMKDGVRSGLAVCLTELTHEILIILTVHVAGPVYRKLRSPLLELFRTNLEKTAASK